MKSAESCCIWSNNMRAHDPVQWADSFSPALPFFSDTSPAAKPWRSSASNDAKLKRRGRDEREKEWEREKRGRAERRTRISHIASPAAVVIMTTAAKKDAIRLCQSMNIPKTERNSFNMGRFGDCQLISTLKCVFERESGGSSCSWLLYAVLVHWMLLLMMIISFLTRPVRGVWPCVINVCLSVCLQQALFLQHTY